MLQTIRFLDVPFVLPMLLVCLPAGFPSPAQDDIEEPIDVVEWLDIDHAATFLMRVTGNSMAGAGIFDEDVIVVSRAKKPAPGKIVVATVPGERTLKRLRRKGDRLWLVAEAEGYPPMIVDEHVEIWGVLGGVIRRYP